MKKSYWIYTLILVSTIFAVEYDVARRMSSKLLTQVRKKETPLAQAFSTPVVTPAKTTQKENAPDSSFFESQFVKEAQKISELQSDPKAVDEKIDQLAKSMDSFELKKLSVLIENKNENADRRAMAVELLTRSKTQEAMDTLKEFVLSHETGSNQNWNRNREFESVLRAQAIEGIAAYPQKDLALSYLNTLSEKVDESFLRDRISRSEENLKGRAPTTEQQDENALKQLVQ